MRILQKLCGMVNTYLKTSRFSLKLKRPFVVLIVDLGNCLPGRVSISDRNVKLLKYADDISLFANTPSVPQLMINTLSDYCEAWGLTVNLAKSKQMVFSKEETEGMQYASNYRGRPIENVKEYVYLGFTISSNRRFVYKLSGEKDRQSKSSYGGGGHIEELSH